MNAIKRSNGHAGVSPLLLEASQAETPDVLSRLATGLAGLSEEEAQVRLERHGPNSVASERGSSQLRLLAHATLNPLVILLVLLASVAFLTEDPRAGTVMSMMVLLGVVLRFAQESRADAAAAKLKAMITVTATVVRHGHRSTRRSTSPRRLPT